MTFQTHTFHDEEELEAAATERESLSLGLRLSSESPRLLMYPTATSSSSSTQAFNNNNKSSKWSTTSYQATTTTAEASSQSVIHSMEIQFIECTRYYRHRRRIVVRVFQL